MTLSFPADAEKTDVFEAVAKYLAELGFRTTHMDDSRPWGGFYYIDEAQSEKFITTYFPHLSVADFEGFAKLSPKILLVAPDARLSWQYHHRRSEIWTVIGGDAAIMVSETDEPGDVSPLPLGSFVSLKQGERHRLIGTEEWGIVAEIWKHTDPNHPSDEEDIVRVQDDFGR
jgi:mannose-6-phosphate isomerase-like protein (cupin superfamily)